MTADNSAAGLTAQLEEVWLALEDLGAGLDDREWALPTPCPGWPVAAQYAHIIGTESMLLGRSRPRCRCRPARPRAQRHRWLQRGVG